MAADVNDIIAYGFGGWSSVNSIPTLGFGIGSAPGVPPPDPYRPHMHKASPDYRPAQVPTESSRRPQVPHAL